MKRRFASPRGYLCFLRRNKSKMGVGTQWREKLDELAAIAYRRIVQLCGGFCGDRGGTDQP